MIKKVIQEMDLSAEKVFKNLSNNLAALRIGRIHPNILSSITIACYGKKDVPLLEVANVNVVNSKTLSIFPWEKKLLTHIEKAILISNIGVTPTNLGDSLILKFPPLSKERREHLSRLVAVEEEKGRISIRNIRKEKNNFIKKLLKKKMVSKDESKNVEKEIQNLTDSMIKKISIICNQKHQELLNF